MKDYFGLIKSTLRWNGMQENGLAGREILIHMILKRIENPTHSYEEICECLRKEGKMRNVDASLFERTLVSQYKDLSSPEKSVLYAIESVEDHDFQEMGRDVIIQYIDKMYEECVCSEYYEKISKRIHDLGLKIDDAGMKLLASMAYKKRISPAISRTKLYEYLLEKNHPSELEPIRRMQSTDRQEMLETKIDSMILESIRRSDVLKNETSVNNVLKMVLSGL